MQQLISDIQRSYGLSVSDARRLDGGYLNCLWYLRTDRGERLAKQFSPRRYTPEKLDALEAALLRQETVRQMGVACPQIFLYQGHALRRTDTAHAYCIIEFCPGKNETAESIGVGQAESLGSACAAVHNAFSRLPVQDVKGFPIREETLLPELWTNYHNKAAVLDGTPPEYQAALLAQPAILEQFDAGFFIRQPKGIAHEDFTPDNVLFDDGGVRAVIVSTATATAFSCTISAGLCFPLCAGVKRWTRKICPLLCAAIRSGTRCMRRIRQMRCALPGAWKACGGSTRKAFQCRHPKPPVSGTISYG